MTNTLSLIGRLTKVNKIGETLKVKIAVNRNYKNDMGIYETDFIPITVVGTMSTNVIDYCRVGDLIGVRGRLETENNRLVIIAEKVLFLATKERTESDDE